MKNRDRILDKVHRFLTVILIVLIAFITIGVVLVGLTSCNKQIFDTTYSFDKAIIELPNGDVIEGEVKSWTDYDDGDQIQVNIDGTTYLVHSSNVTLINEDKGEEK